MKFEFEPLNLYTNYEVAATKYPNSKLFFDKEVAAFSEFENEISYKESLELIKYRAYQLYSVGIKKNDQVVIFKSSALDTYLLAVCVSYLGAIPVMISHHFNSDTMDKMISRLDNPYLIYDYDTETKVNKLNTLDNDKLIKLEELINLKVTFEVKQEYLDLDDISYMTHTSGTTGVPKLICHSANSMGYRIQFQKSIFDKMTDKKLLAFHISPVHSRFNIGIASLMGLGYDALAIRDADETSVINTLSKYEVYALETHPNNFVQWSNIAKKHPELFNSIKYYHSTFDAINPETMHSFLQASSHQDSVFLQIYGQSECGPMIIKAHTLKSLEDTDGRDMGFGFPGLTKARICNENGDEVTNNTKGNIHLYSIGRALTYYKEDERFKTNVYGDWWDSGDYGLIDDTGSLKLLDRQIDIVKDIDSTLAIEDMLLDNLEFLDEVVIIRGKNDMPQPVIAIKKDHKFNKDLWFKSLTNLPHILNPIIMDYESIPRTATMKVRRVALESSLKED